MRYLVAGLGNIGRRRQALLGDRCVATADPFNSEADFASAEDCPVDMFDAVVLAIPNEGKVRLLEHFLSLGKHVLVEKPLLFPDRDTAERLEHIARAHSVVWYTSYNHRFEPLIERLREHMRAGAIGELYHGRLLYGNGTVRHVINTWREGGLGVLEDLGSHLLDLAGHVLGRRGDQFRPWSLERHESQSYDHVVFGSADGCVVLEGSFLSWKNTFCIDLYGDRGSLHLNGLPKWGSAQLVLRERILPSGIPLESCEAATPNVDVTWGRDLAHFEQLTVNCDETSMENDLWISQTLHAVAGT